MTMEKLSAAISFLRELDEEMTLTRAAILLVVAERWDVSIAEIQEVLDLKQSATSRNVYGLTDRGATRDAKKGGLGLVETYDDPNDMRFRRVRLTDRGRQVIAKLGRVVS